LHRWVLLGDHSFLKTVIIATIKAAMREKIANPDIIFPDIKV
jgi:hypothetical protein